ncbi:Spo0E family sporulation regulatory protein-aspartic acid phosphatase [Paenibacillus faecalis]|uniref:Spo0E family sporulation regulatory protein-aspartic acid phosphatase n=1 Tax=Paenibacillus faecalis TaxID=2079532 RepID=UPI000D1092D0|nr:Spo0E family sporulation regulatory protein-aspartic acid phosphatase [Paenibacillus faecalis]
MSNSRVIQDSIERERHKLHFLTQEYGALGHPKVIQQSMVLDDLINQYIKLDKKKVEKPTA